MNCYRLRVQIDRRPIFAPWITAHTGLEAEQRARVIARELGNSWAGRYERPLPTVIRVIEVTPLHLGDMHRSEDARAKVALWNERAA